MPGFFDTKIEFLKGVGPLRADLLLRELNISTFGDLIQHYPFRYEDRTHYYTIAESRESTAYVQIRGVLRNLEQVGKPRYQRLVAQFQDRTGTAELVWFKGVNWIKEKLRPGAEYVIFGKPNLFKGKLSFPHPEIEPYALKHNEKQSFHPVYSSTEKLRSKYLDSKGIAKLQASLWQSARNHIHESLPQSLINNFRLISKKEALQQIHFPENLQSMREAEKRLKFEELFYIQLRLLMMKITRTEQYQGQIFQGAELLTDFYNNHLPFQLTSAQKRVIKEAYKDMRSGNQMNRLIQGDVGSGKTIVAFICMLLVIGNDAQTALMAPTEILADQHFTGLKEFAKKLNIHIAKLTGSTPKSERKIIHQMLRDGSLKILVGTHALLEEEVQFKNLGLAVVDEQHRFGVAQRAKLWQKHDNFYPHVLVMTATPIPRTLAMTLYGDLDVSVIDELPAGRKPIITRHFYDSSRLKVNGFIRQQIDEGRQVYIVYPLIEESEKLSAQGKTDLKDLMDGYESIQRAFPKVPISIVHGRMKATDKDFEMQRFIKKETKIMVATTVIEVGVNVPNASVMIVENAERFGLAQLHQLRGRVGRGGAQSYCILMTRVELTKEGRERIKTLVRTNNGFEIAEADLKLRGPGDLAGTQQSGLPELFIANLAQDGKVLKVAREAAIRLLENDPDLSHPENKMIKSQIAKQRKSEINWSRIS